MSVIFFHTDFIFDTDNPGANNYTYRQLFPASELLLDVYDVILKFAHTTGLCGRIAEAWIGHEGTNPYDFDGNQVQVMFSGSPSVEIDQPGILSDVIDILLDSSKPLIFSAYVSNTGCDDVSITSESDPIFRTGYKIGNFAGDTSFSGYGTSGHSEKIFWIFEILGTTPFSISGTIKEKGTPVIRSVRSYIRSTGVLFASGNSESDGSFSISAPNDTTEMFVVAFDDDAGDQYNALIYDRVKGTL